MSFLRAFSACRSGLLLAVVATGCGLTNPFEKIVAPTDAGPSTLMAPLLATLASPTPTNDPAVTLTVTWCGQITSVLVNEGGAPSDSDAGWQPCTTAAGAISYQLASGGGAHFLHVWGRDAAGRISGTPTQVAVMLGTSAFAMGDAHSCALVAGAVKCWGDNRWGQLGDGSVVESSATAVTPTGLDSGVDMIVSGHHGATTCALRGGQVWCWGANTLGQLGAASTTQCTGGTTSGACSRTPVLVVDGIASPLQGAVSIHGGKEFFCARMSDDSVRCWGNNALGQLGDARVSGMKSATPVATALGQGVQWMESGYATSCALLSDGSGVSCWGQDYAVYDGYGPGSALIGGTPPVASGSLFVATTPRTAAALTDAIPDALVIGYYHACALFSGEVKCWGLNKVGQMGNGIHANATELQTVTLTAKADLLIAGAHHTCARLVTGEVSCWGMDDVAQLAVKDSDLCADGVACSRVPLTIPGLDHVAGMGAGRSQSCAVTDAGIVCWGSDNAGLLQGGSAQTCVAVPQADPSPCSHTPVVMQGF